MKARKVAGLDSYKERPGVADSILVIGKVGERCWSFRKMESLDNFQHIAGREQVISLSFLVYALLPTNMEATRRPAKSLRYTFPRPLLSIGSKFLSGAGRTLLAFS